MAKRKISALLIFLAGLGVFLFTVGGGRTPEFEPVVKSAERISGSAANLDFEANLLDSFSARPTETAAPTDPNNLTDLLGRMVLEGIVKENPQGLQNIDGLTALKKPSEATFDNLLKERIATPFAVSTFSKNDIKLLVTDSKNDQIAYIEAVARILKKYADRSGGTFSNALTELLEKSNPAPLNKIVENIPGLLDEFLVLRIPPSYSVIHIQLLNLWQKKLVYYDALLNNEADPLKAYLALSEIVSIGDEDLNLRKFLSNRYEALKS